MNSALVYDGDEVLGAVIPKRVWIHHQCRWTVRYFAMSLDGTLVGRHDGYLHERPARSKLLARRSYERRMAA